MQIDSSRQQTGIRKLSIAIMTVIIVLLLFYSFGVFKSFELQVLDFLIAGRGHAIANNDVVLVNIDDEKLLEAQEIFQWTGETLLERFIYILKHCYYHFGYMNRIIRIKENIPIDWR